MLVHLLNALRAEDDVDDDDDAGPAPLDHGKVQHRKGTRKRNCVQPSRTTWRRLGRPLHSTWWEQSPQKHLCSIYIRVGGCIANDLCRCFYGLRRHKFCP